MARAVWEAGVAVAAAYPGTPSTEILEVLSTFPDIDTHWAVNEKVSLEVAIGASLAGARAFCAMKHVGLNVAADALMSQTLAGVNGGLVIVVADDVGLSSSQNEQDSRFWGRFAHIPVMEPADSQEAYEMVKLAFEISEQFDTPVLVRATTRVCHVKSLASIEGRRLLRPATGFTIDPKRWVLMPSTAKIRLPKQFERDGKLKLYSEGAAINQLMEGGDRRIGFVSSGPAALAVREAFPDAPVLKLGFSHPAPIERIRALAGTVDTLVVVEETEPLLETELKAAGITVQGKDVLPRMGELSYDVIRPRVAAMLGETCQDCSAGEPAQVFPRPPTMCVGCPHLAPYYVLARLRDEVLISGDIGCYTLGAGQPWNALDTTICMGASMGVALGISKAKGEVDKNRAVVAVIGDSTFLHMGMQGLLDITYNKGNVTVLLLDNRTVGMTGGQENPGTGRDIHGNEAPSIDFPKLVEALGVKPERIKVINPYELPTLMAAVKEEITTPEPSVIITNQPCVLTDRHIKFQPMAVDDDKCNGCANCLRV
ncbi:MAG: indolepyruvate ferredoxin oxidoreductase, partial [Rhodospirillales bacterium]|nr:indolepyruvate ferredoxin oxidoreductase [Rhodospirillales bacterium]